MDAKQPDGPCCCVAGSACDPEDCFGLCQEAFPGSTIVGVCLEEPFTCWCYFAGSCAKSTTSEGNFAKILKAH
ncbi:unnamed protein product [Darwinula stevensoni]|uniref:Uncharacterized protein n=1 Tax=Darwinula stevensoni TaxID=69355 RepID=A0A7R8X9G8_9CRUS|nr:unnamed protein product [Darwinula stevensoni]CAG0890634.1 unnamed protein product [Darwinula stevensoni]